MSSVRIFRNDGEQMFAEEPAQLDYIDPGIVLLYADRRKNIVCSYFEGHLGQPIQATVEHTFEGEIDLGQVRSYLVDNDDLPLHIRRAPEAEPTNRRWALDGLDSPPLPLGELQLNIIQALLNPTVQYRSQTDGGIRERLTEPDWDPDDNRHSIDLAVGTVKDGARLFTHLLEKLDDLDFTIAVSMSGRIDTLAETDVVIHVDGSHLDTDQKVAPVAETEQKVATVKEQLLERSIGQRIHEPIKTLRTSYSDAVDEFESSDQAEEVLRKELESGLARISGLTVVDYWDHRKRTGLLTIAGLLTGFASGVFASDGVFVVLERSADALRDTISMADLINGSLADLFTTSLGTPLYAWLAISSVMILVGSLLFRRSYTREDTQRLGSTTVRRDAISLSTNITAGVSLLVLVVSLALLWSSG